MEKEIGYRALKEAGSKGIEDALTKAIRELTGDESYKVSINNVDFDSDGRAWMYDKTNVGITISREQQFYGIKTEVTDKESASPA